MDYHQIGQVSPDYVDPVKLAQTGHRVEPLARVPITTWELETSARYMRQVARLLGEHRHLLPLPVCLIGDLESMAKQLDRLANQRPTA
jgi:hypothetical protein